MEGAFLEVFILLHKRRFYILEIGEFFGTFLSGGDAQRFLFVIVEIARVAGAFAFRNKWSFNLEKKTPLKIDNLFRCFKLLSKATCPT